METKGVRVDKWLWAARFFKTRSIARAAVLGGKVRLDGQRVKPGRTLKEGQKLIVTRGEEHFDITIKMLSDRRVSATLAKDMFEEDPASIERRETQAEENRLQRKSRMGNPGRPDKRDRRLITGFTRKR